MLKQPLKPSKPKRKGIPMFKPTSTLLTNIAVASGASQFPERYFATCHRRVDGHVERFRVYADSLAICLAKARKAGDASPKIYDAILRSRVK